MSDGWLYIPEKCFWCEKPWPCGCEHYLEDLAYLAKKNNNRPYVYNPAFMSSEEARGYFESIMTELKPKFGPADTYGKLSNGGLDCSKAFQGYRESLWIGPAVNPGRSEARRCTHGPEQREWPDVLLEIKARVEAATNEQFNSCLVNLYPQGKGGIGPHRDMDDESDWTHSIASVSLGEERRFNIYDNQMNLLSSEALEHGSLCVMPAGFQAKHLHEIPKQADLVDPRINLTFRWIADWIKKGGVDSRKTEPVHCMKHQYDVYIGRANPGNNLPESNFANRAEGDVESYFKQRLINEPNFAAALMSLHGKRLGCWCKGTSRDFSQCHGHILAKWADRIYAKWQELKPDKAAMRDWINTEAKA